MKRTVLLVVLAVIPAVASGKASLRGLGGEIGEVSHEVDIDLRMGAVASIKTTQVVVATRLWGTSEAQAVYTFDLPSDAAVIGLEVSLPGGKRSKGQIVGADAAHSATEAPAGSQPDSAYLRLLELDGERATYELRVFPVTARRTTKVTIEWLLPVRQRAGVGVLRLPPRGQNSNLVNETVTVRNVPRRFASVVGSGRELGKGRNARFKGSLLFGVVAELRPRAGAANASLEFAAVALPGDRSAALVRIAAGAPERRKELSAERVLFVVNISKSMGQSRALAEKLVAALLDDTPDSAAIDAIVFARGARSVLGGFASNTSDNRARLLATLSDASATNGTDLSGAIALADRQLAGATRGARVIILSDAITPLAQTPKAMTHAASSAFLSDVRVAHITLVPDNVPLPPAVELSASSLTRRKGSRMVALRTSDAHRQAEDLWQSLWAPPPLRDITLSSEREFLGEQPSSIAPGNEAVLIGFFRGVRPTSMQLSGAGGAGDLVLQGRRARALERTVLPLVAAAAQDLPNGFDDIELIDVATKAHVVSKATSLIAPYPGDRFASERLRLARQFGAAQFRRVAPEVEDELMLYMFSAPPPSLLTPPRSSQKVPTGTLGRDIAERLVQTHVIPKARGCYKRSLIPSKNLRGRLTLVFEMARGEVHEARIEGSLSGDPAWAARVEACVVDAAYSIQVPVVNQGSSWETISVVRYPLRFHIVDAGGRIVPAAPMPDKIRSTADPLGGI